MPQFNPDELTVWLSPWTAQLATFALVLARVSGLLSVGPLLGRAILPWQARIGLAFVLSLVLTPLVGAMPLSNRDWRAFIPSAVTELGLGFLLGCGSLLILWSIPLAGRLLDQQHALPADDEEDLLGGSPLARWLTLWGTTCFLLCSPINGHWQVVQILADSFQTWPLGSSAGVWESRMLALLLQHACRLSLLLIAPALATMTLINLSIGLMGASGLSGASVQIGNTTRSLVAALVIAASLSGIQQSISDYVRDGITLLDHSPNPQH